MNVTVLLNGQAGGGCAAKKWYGLEAHLAAELGRPAAVYDQSADWASLVSQAAQHGPAMIIAAGGDGTVHRVANLLLAGGLEDEAAPLMGAVALGSSNDFHKPLDGCRRIQGVPIRCDWEDPVRQNVLRIEHSRGAARRHVEYAVTGCSLGAVALGNELFNHKWGPVKLARRLGVSTGVWCASLAAIAKQRPFGVGLVVEGRPVYEGDACLVGLYVNRHFTGTLSYGGAVDVSSPQMGVIVLPGVSLPKRVALLGRAARSGLSGDPCVRSWQGTSCEVTLARPGLLEMDGEVVQASHVRVQLVPGALGVCQ